jgi:hypothetical protein
MMAHPHTRHPVRGAARQRCAADTGSCHGSQRQFQDPGSSRSRASAGMTGAWCMAEAQKLIGISLEGSVG